MRARKRYVTLSKFSTKEKIVLAVQTKSNAYVEIITPWDAVSMSASNFYVMLTLFSK
jgi:hypothetical protein